jgi:hypothetical protein
MPNVNLSVQPRLLSCGASLVAVVAMFGAAETARAQAPAKDASQVTFTKDVAPILQRSCQTCHRAGNIARH